MSFETGLQAHVFVTLTARWCLHGLLHVIFIINLGSSSTVVRWHAMLFVVVDGYLSLVTRLF